MMKKQPKSPNISIQSNTQQMSVNNQSQQMPDKSQANQNAYDGATQQIPVAGQASQYGTYTKPQSHVASHVKQDEEVITRKRKKRKINKPHNKAKRVLIVLSIILAAMLLVIAAFCIIQEIGKNNMKNVEYTEGKVVEYNGEKYQYNENIISTLILGHDKNTNSDYGGKNGQSDFILLMTLDTESGRLRGISIPRDTMIEIGEYFPGSVKMNGEEKIQICLAFGYGDGYEKSCDNMVAAVSRLLYNIPIKYYFSLNLDGIGPLNDAIGGVTLVPIESIPNTIITEGDEITLLGNNAKKYVQYRNKSDIMSSEQRRKREAQYVSEFYKQAFSSNHNITTAIDLFNQAKNYSITNLGIPEFSYLAGVVINKGISKFEIASVQGTVTQGEKWVEIWPDQKALYELVLDTFYTKIDTNNQ